MASTSVYERAHYLDASARHIGAEIELAGARGTSLPVLRLPDGSRRTAYGLARPCGDPGAGALAALADELAADRTPLTAIFSPLEPGPSLARLLVERGGHTAGERPICVARFDGADPGEQFDRRARRAIRTAHARGARTVVEGLEPWFGPFYRAAMEQLDAEPVYFFSDQYFDALAALSHYVISVHDEHGVAAATLFLDDGEAAYYHLGGRRDGVEPVVGAMSLALGEGIREAARRGNRLAVLGGGRTDSPDDSLFLFKRQLAPEALPRITVSLPGAGTERAAA